jgi:hypothetical protein
VQRQDACRKAALHLVSLDRVPEDRSGVLETSELFRAQPLSERRREQQRRGGAPRAPRGEQERRQEVSGAQVQLASARPEQRRVSRPPEPQVHPQQAQQRASPPRADEPQQEAPSALPDVRAQRQVRVSELRQEARRRA